MSKRAIILGWAACGLLLGAGGARAGATIQVDDEIKLNIGMRAQVLAIATKKDVGSDGDLDSFEDFKVRRARLRLRADVTEYMSAFLQTESAGAAGGSGLDMRVIDAQMTLKPKPWAHLVVGQHMVPASRQTLTSSSALLALDRPGISYKNLSWGMRSLHAYANQTIPDTDSGVRSDAAVRDTGATLFGTHSFSDELHAKAYLGVYDGVQAAGADGERVAARVQVNAFEPEDRYFGKATYLGAKKTLAIGASADMQDEIADSDDAGPVDYRFYTVDLFAEWPEWPCGSTALSLEAAYAVLDLDGTSALDHDADPTTPGRNAQQAAGEGYFVQVGCLLNPRWQPWAEYEHWSSDAADGRGSYEMYRVGVTYFIKGQYANLKAGLERLELEQPYGKTPDTEVDSVVIGAYLNY